MYKSPRPNRLGTLAIALAAISIVSYLGQVAWSAYSGTHPAASGGKLGGLAFTISPLAALASTAIGTAALQRAKRGAGGRGQAIVGFLLGALLTLWFAAWFIGLALNPGAVG